MAKLTFAEQIKHPNWQRKRLEVMEAAGFMCENCGANDVTLNVHHRQYVKGRMYWDYERSELQCLCENCHKSEHDARDGLASLLAEVSTADAYSFLAGYHFHSDWLDPSITDRARRDDQLMFAAGFVGWMVLHLDLPDMEKVARYAASLMNEFAEPRMVFTHDSGPIFGHAESPPGDEASA